MDFKLTAEQEAIQLTVREFARARIAPCAAGWEERIEFPRDAFREMAALGLAGLHCSPEHGGMGLDTLTAAVVYEELGKAYQGLSFVGIHNMVASLIEEYGTKEQKERWLRRLANGELLGAFANTEPNAGSDVLAIETTASRTAHGYLINGAKVFVTGGGEAEIYIVTAKTDRSRGRQGMSALVVEKGAPGFTFGRVEKKMGLMAIPNRELIFQDCLAPSDHLLGHEGEGFDISMRSFDSSRIEVGAFAVGLAQAALEAALDYSKRRTQFGRPIAEFQALRFMLADMATEIQAARLLVYHAAYLMDQRLSFTKDASMAKRFATDVAMRVTTDAVQVFGAYGYLQDYVVERYMREAKALQISEGTNQIQRIIIARELLANA
ncbi:MAG: acyl-CoA dehydrogenase family protein [Dehalococcoidia bacterium]|nr:acyl-CoA dehydrogenase family protein [Dehalococcoidia bacterium]